MFGAAFGYGWGVPPNMPVVYLVICEFTTGDWYLNDVINEELIVRKWTTVKKRAMQFDKKEEAETVGYMVCHPGKFKIDTVYKHMIG